MDLYTYFSVYFYNFCVDLEVTHRNTHMATLTYTNEYYVSTFFVFYTILHKFGQNKHILKILLLHILYFFLGLVYIYIIDEILEKDILKGGDGW